MIFVDDTGITETPQWRCMEFTTIRKDQILAVAQWKDIVAHSRRQTVPDTEPTECKTSLEA